MRIGFNIALDHRPHSIIDVSSADDVVAAVGRGLPVAVLNTGHGPSVPADGAALVRVGRMNRVAVDPIQRTARIGAGARWRDVIAAAAPHGLAPLNGSSPAVGAVGYTLGGGIGLLSRRFGFAADHVRRFELVTADGQTRRVDDTSDPDLFWALRGAGANFGVVTAMEVDLFPVSTLFGGEMCFAAEHAEAVLHAYSQWAGAVPEAMASSVLLLDGTISIRLAWSGEVEEGTRWVRRLRGVAPRTLDTVRVMPYTDVGTIHDEPTDEPVPAFDRNILLSRFDSDAVTMLLKYAGPGSGAPFLTELRAWGGGLSRPARVPNVVGGRDATFSLLAISDPNAANRARRDELLAAMRPWGTGATYPNFSGVEDTASDAVQRGFRPDDFATLRRLKRIYDPDNIFRVNFNVPPDRSAS